MNRTIFLCTSMSSILFILFFMSCSHGYEIIVDEEKKVESTWDSISQNVNAHNSLSTPLFIAHRGCRAFGPENSIPAFIGAGKMKMWAIETDFRITKDSVVVCMHDATIDNTTNGRGRVSDYTYAELLSYKLKEEEFANKYYRYEDLSQKELQIPTMDEYFDICLKYGCIPFIELKSDNGIIDKMIESINNHGLTGKTIVSSSDMSLLRKVREKACNERIHHIFSNVNSIDALLLLGNAGLAFNITDLESDISNKYEYTKVSQVMAHLHNLT